MTDEQFFKIMFILQSGVVLNDDTELLETTDQPEQHLLVAPRCNMPKREVLAMKEDPIDKFFRFADWLEDEGPILAGVIFSIALIIYGIWAAITDF